MTKVIEPDFSMSAACYYERHMHCEGFPCRCKCHNDKALLKDLLDELKQIRILLIEKLP